ncbi:hypothetical protein TNCV_4984681 [Trichonephila clavipes]|nr:hypothetical protein TNCV_4984681 [Trichonephila clavipes]
MTPAIDNTQRRCKHPETLSCSAGKRKKKEILNRLGRLDKNEFDFNIRFTLKQYEAIGDGLSNPEPRPNDDDTSVGIPSPNFHTTPMGGL